MHTAVAILLAFFGWCAAFNCGCRHEVLTRKNAVEQIMGFASSILLFVAAFAVMP